MNYSYIVENINSKCLDKQKAYSFCNINFKIAFDNRYLESEYEQIIYPHIMQNYKDNISYDFIFNTSIDDDIFSKIKSDLKNRKKETLTMTFCTTEKGTIRINKYIDSNFIIFESLKTESLLIVDTKYSTFNYLTTNNNINMKNFFKDFYMYFEHVVHKKCNEKGSILVHASAVVDALGKVIVFTGKKRAGKTTMLFESCKKLNYHPLSVDKVHLLLENNKIKVFSFPTRLRVLSGTLTRYPELHNLIPPKYINSSEEELWKGLSDSKIEIKIPEFEKFIKKKFVLTGYLDKIILTNISNENIKERLILDNNNNNKTKNLLDNIYTPHNPEEDWWSDIGKSDIQRINLNTQKTLDFIYNNIIIGELFAKKNIVDLISKL